MNSNLPDDQIKEVASNINTPEDLLAFSQAISTLENLKEKPKPRFPFEMFVRYTGVAIGAAVGAGLLILSGITSYFESSYTFAKQALEDTQENLSTTEAALRLAKTDLEETAADLLTTEKSFSALKLENAELTEKLSELVRQVDAERSRSEELEQQIAEQTERVTNLSAQYREAQESLAEAVQNNPVPQSPGFSENVAQLQKQLNEAEERLQRTIVENARMYVCNPRFVSKTFEILSEDYRVTRLSALNFDPDFAQSYVSVQLYPNNSFQFQSNIKDLRSDHFSRRTEFATWGLGEEHIELFFDTSPNSRFETRIETIRLRRDEVLALAEGRLGSVCDEGSNGLCLFRNRTC